MSPHFSSRRVLVDASRGSELQVRAVATRDYRPRTEREVGLVRGQLAVLVTRLDTHWYLGRVTGHSGAERMGLVPGECSVVTASSDDNNDLVSFPCGHPAQRGRRRPP